MMGFEPAEHARNILQAVRIVSPMQPLESFYYDVALGIYRPAEDKIQKWVHDALGAEDKAHRYKEVLHHIEGGTMIEREAFAPPENCICLKNGVLNLLTREFMPHSPDFYFTSRIPVEYNPESQCPAIEKFLEEVSSFPEEKKTLLEMAAYCLWPSYPLQKAFLVLGEGANGKTKYLMLLQRFIGEENYSGLSLQQIAHDRFAAAHLRGKMANIYDDLNQEALRQTGVFKMAVGGGHFSAERKFKEEHVQFVNRAKMIFSANRLPLSKNDDSEAFFRRWVLLPFTRKFVAGTPSCDPHILEKITTPQELSGLLNRCLEILPALLENGFSYNPDTDSVREQYLRLSDPTSAFVLDSLEPKPDNAIPTEDLYRKYVEFCRAGNLTTKSPGAFTSDLRRAAPWISRMKRGPRGGQVYCYIGAAYKQEEAEGEPETPQSRLGNEETGI